MPEKVTTCPSCGHDSHDLEWCDNCGTRLQTGADGSPTWLEPASKVTVHADDHSTAAIEIERAVDTFATRRVLFGKVVDATGALAEYQDRRVMVEEKEEPEDNEGKIPEELTSLFRTALATGKHGPHSVRAYEDTGAMTVEDLADIVGGELSYKQIKDIFIAVANAVIEAHAAGYLVLAIAPWTIRIEGGAFTEPPPDALLSTDTLDGYEDITIEAPRPDAATLAAARSAAEEEARVASEASDASDASVDAAGDTEELPEPGTELDDPSPDDAPVEEDAADAEPDDESQEVPAEDADEEVESVEEAEEAEPFADVDDGWGALDDSDSLGDTGLLSIKEIEAPTRAFFEGIDELIPTNEEPYEVPVIMGFSPPELLGRVRADVGEHCDVFALGMLLYYLLAGRVPPASVYTRYTPAIPARNFRPGFPPGLQPIISRATRPSPNERFPNVVAMRDAFLNACAMMERRAENVGGPHSPRAVVAVDTHVGIAKGRRNPTNQDSVFGKISEDGRFALIVVADGVSTASYGSGDLASNFLTKTAREIWAEVLPKYLMEERIDEVEIISKILDIANERIVAHVNEHFQPFEGNPHEVMGTTSLIAVIRQGIATIASLGDSRVYLQTTSGLEQVTADHNLWTLSVLDGISADAALSMPHGDALARCLGTFVIDGKRLESVPPEADYFRFTLTRGDTLLMTTDGLIDFAGPNPFASEENVLAVMLAEPDPALACLELVLLANRGGGGDNIGVGIIHLI